MISLLIVVQACEPRLLKPTIEQAHICREEMALRGVLVRVEVEHNPMPPPLAVAVAAARGSQNLYRHRIISLLDAGVMVLVSDFEHRDIYDVFGVAHSWSKHDGTPTFLSYTE